MSIDDVVHQALDIAQAQAGVRAMSAAEVVKYTEDLTHEIRNALQWGVGDQSATDLEQKDGKSSIREGAIICLECGRSFKVLTIRHLMTHGLTAKEYRTKWGIKKGTSLVCKSLLRSRRKKMKEMRLWERRKGVVHTDSNTAE